MDEPDGPGGGTDTGGHDAARPNIARVQDFVVGGTEHLEIDREYAAEMLAVVPGIAEVVVELWEFGRRVVAHLAARGFDQFLDLGCGLPSVRPVHEVAAEQGVRPRVVYVDNDATTVAHARRLVADVDGAVAVAHDVADPGALLADGGLRAVLDLDRPVAVLANAVLQYVDDEVAAAALAALHAACAPGSHLVVAHLSSTGRPEAQQWADARRGSGLATDPRLREPAQMEQWLTGWELVAPGWTAAPAWSADAASASDPAEAGAAYWCATARRP